MIYKLDKKTKNEKQIRQKNKQWTTNKTKKKKKNKKKKKKKKFLSNL
jgi:hypothetical protein